MPWYIYIGGAAISLALGLLVWISAKRTRADTRIASLEGRAGAQDARIDTIESQKAIRSDYVEVLRQHIIDQKPPPPPPYPEGY